MKITLILCALSANALAATPILVRVTPQTLAELQARNPMIRLVKPQESQAHVIRPDNQSIIKDSTIIHDGKNWTLVPNDAVVFIPAALKTRVNAKPVGNLLSWSDFLMQNRAWVTTSEVSFEQAAGTEALPAERVLSWKKQDKIVIAVHQSGPISVRISNETSSSSLTAR